MLTDTMKPTRRRDHPGLKPRESGRPARILMCPPDYFDVRYEINPWMDTRVGVGRDLAREQWEALHRALACDIGAEVEIVDPVAGLPDFVFTANAGFLAGDTFIASNFRYPERAWEERHWQEWFESKGYRVARLPANLRFEGEGDLLSVGDLIIAGYRFRSDREAVESVGLAAAEGIPGPGAGRPLVLPPGHLRVPCSRRTPFCTTRRRLRPPAAPLSPSDSRMPLKSRRWRRGGLPATPSSLTATW